MWKGNDFMKSIKKNEKSFVGIKGKSKTIKLRSGESIMDGNSVQMPFIAPYRISRNKETGALEPLTYIEYQWTSVENGVEVTRGINVNGHGKLGVPTLKDKEVLRALQDIYIWDKIENGVLELETDPDKVKDSDLFIDFKTIDNIATSIGYDRISGQQRKSIKESIERLVATTVFNTHSGGLYDPIQKKYITNSKESYRYLEEMKDYTVYDCDNCLYTNGCLKDFDNCINPDKKTDVTKIKMSKFLYLTIANNYRLYYDNINTKQIKNLIAKNIYMISRKWLGDGYISRANIQKYIDRIPMNAKKEKHRKQAIKEGVELLNSYDFVEASIDKDIITVVHLDKMPTNLKSKQIEDKDKIPADTSYLKDKFNKYSEFRQGFIELGFTESELDDYIDMQKIRYQTALLRYVTLKCKYNSDIDGKEYYINCLNKKLKIDKKYYGDSE